jgi:CO/xanthine dehydrogenase FAD-binding subunit
VIAPRRPAAGPVAVSTLREVNDLAFLHRERVRFRAGTSELLAVALEPQDDDGFVVDVREVGELRAIAQAPNGAPVIGAFAPCAAVAIELPAICPSPATLANARMRVGLHDPRVRVYGLGATRLVPLDRLVLAPHELPVALELAPPRPGLGIAERRRTTNDGEASFTLGVTVALRVTALARFEHVRVFVDLDGAIRRAGAIEEALEGRRCDRDLFLGAARAAATAIPATDARSSALARSLPPLVVAALRDAFDAAKNR